MQALTLLERNHFVPGSSRTAQGGGAGRENSLSTVLGKSLADSDRAIQMKTMQVLGKYQRQDSASRAMLENMVKGEDQVLAAAAAGLLR
jgi:hypothetical protein